MSDDWVNKILRQQQEHIDTIGWAVTGVFPREGDDGAPFAYTIGLTERGSPELVISGLDTGTMHALLNDLAGRVFDRAERFSDGQRISDLLNGYDAAVIDGALTEELWPGTAVVRYGRNAVRLQQIVWPDREGRFPWEPGYALASDVQPLLAREDV
jgi:hypothetical protein